MKNKLLKKKIFYEDLNEATQESIHYDLAYKLSEEVSERLWSDPFRYNPDFAEFEVVGEYIKKHNTGWIIEI